MSATSDSAKAISQPESAPAASSVSHPLVGALRRRYLAGTLSVVGGLLLWELVSRVVVANALFLAAPSEIVVAIYNLAVTGQLWHHIGISAAEFALGYVIASSSALRSGLPWRRAPP